MEAGNSDDNVATMEVEKHHPTSLKKESEVNFLSRLFFQFAQPIFTQASNLHKQNKALELEDLLPLPDDTVSKIIGPLFEEVWRKQKSPARIAPAVRAVVGKRFIFAGFIKVINTVLQFFYPILLNEILKFIEEAQSGSLGDPNTAPWYVTYRGYWLTALFFLSMIGRAVAENIYFHMVYRAGYQARVALSTAVYNKALRLGSAERQSTTLGELVNLMQVDASKIESFVPNFHVLWEGIFQIIGYLAILYMLIGWPCFVGLGVMILGFPLQAIVMKNLFGLNRVIVKHTDERVKACNEAFQGIRCVKMYTWEDSFHKLISESRNGETKVLKSIAIWKGLTMACMNAIPAFVAVATFIVYSVTFDEDLSASTLFAALVAFNQLRYPLIFYPMALGLLVQASVSAKRIEVFLNLKEIQSDSEGHKVYNRYDETLKTGEVSIKDISIYWEDPKVPVASNKQGNDDEKASKSTNKSPDNDEIQEELRYPDAILRDVSMDISPGELCAVIGRVGCGKSTLCSAMLNETLIASGSVSLKGSIAYAAQTPWILNASLRDNITFGLPYEKDKYDEIIRVCQLTHDISLFDHGDLTEIGEKGINLSGGQCQRVSIARAAYSGADIVVLDDPLSALDPEVAKKLFDECIVKLMKNKTRILVTNQLQFLRFCDIIIAIEKGTIAEQGTLDQVSSNTGEIGKLLSDLSKSKKPSEAEKTSDESEGGRKKDNSIVEEPKTDKKGKDLLTKEERNVGAVAWHVYKKFIQAGGGIPVFFLVLCVAILGAANDFMNTFWISLWTSDASYEKRSQSYYLGFYALLAVSYSIFEFIRSFYVAFFVVRAGKRLHDNLLASVLRAPMSFFDTTPTGRILSRFSQDFYRIDMETTDPIDFLLLSILSIVFAFGAIFVATPWFAVAVVPIIYFYIKIMNYFREVSRETKRLESISRSPVFAQFSETLGGLGTIRAYNQVSRFIYEFEHKVDLNTRTTYNIRTADRWLSVRLECLGSTIAGLAAVFACSVVISGTKSLVSSSTNFAAIAGLSLTYAIKIMGLLSWGIRCFANLEASMNATERIVYYTEDIPHEAPAASRDLDLLAKKKTPANIDIAPSTLAVRAAGKAEDLSHDWPSKGKITFSNLKMKYRPENPLVIKGLNVEIEGGSRVGVVGRTGSGKSSLLLTLLRIVEPTLDQNKLYKAPITIDGVDILRIGTTDLRSRIAIIPQNPVLFSGTIRSNIDPFHKHTDDVIWDALKACGMKRTIEEMSASLDSPVAEYGENLSQGQRQLLCLGRALLKRCRILLLDEATSSIDYETDKEIQRTLREAFVGCTVLTIAHRVNTILDSDKILVMTDGKVGEFASPQELLANETSLFAELVKHSQAESENE